MSTKSNQNRSPSPSPSPSPPPASFSSQEIAAEPSTTGNAPFALPLRVRELKHSTRHPKDRPSQKHGVRKTSQKVNPEKPEKDVCPMREVTIKTRHDEETFKWDVAICKYAQGILHPRCCVSQFVSSDPSTQTLVIRAPVIGCTPFYNHILMVEFDSATVKLIKKTLRSYVRLLYRLGVGYSITAHGIYVLNAHCHPGWVLHLRNVMYSDFCEESKRKDPEWDAKKRRQYARIDRIFKPIEESVAKDEAWRKAKQQTGVREPDVTMKESDFPATDASATTKEESVMMREP